MKRVKTRLIEMTLFSTIFLGSCATSVLALPPPLEQRTLRFSRGAPALEYQYRICTAKILGICTKSEMKVESWDLTDERVRAQLIDMGFVARMREKP